MKKVFVVWMFGLSATLLGQTQDEIKMIQSLYGNSKAEIIKGSMNLTQDKSVAFDKIYKAYEAERASLGAQKLKIIEDYGFNYLKITDQKADELAQAALKNNLDFEKLYTKTYNKTKKEIGAKEAAKFIQLEVYFQTIIRAEMQDAIPFIDELDRTKKI